MKILYSWLQDYIDISQTPEQLAEDLSIFGHEVESMKKIGDNDAVLDLEITPNRGDCLSILGIAREIAALYGLKLKEKKYEIKSQKIDKKFDVKIADAEICQRFTARLIDNITITDSPGWLQKRLKTYGFRPINNIIDITNYVMIATGQPLHAFDFDKIKDGLLNIRLSKKGEEIMTLDGKNHILNDEAIIIEDGEKIYDLAGIMGGIKSEVDEKTKTIILQGAIFDSVLIRRASKYLKQQTDASYRYERGVDSGGTILGVDMAASLIKEICSEVKIGELIDIKAKDSQEFKIIFDEPKINRLLGINLSRGEMNQSLEKFYFKVEASSAVVPSFRIYDVKIWQDLAEEIARIYGYNKIIKSELPKEEQPQESPEWREREIIKDFATEVGFTENYSYSFADKNQIEILGYKITDCLETANPIAPELKYLRPSLLPSLLAQIAKNPWAPEIRIFEIEKVFDKEKEWWQFGLVTTGNPRFYIEKVMSILKIKGEVKSVSQDILNAFKIRKPVYYFIIDIRDIKYDFPEKVSYKISSHRYRPISKFAPTIRDLAFIVEGDAQLKKIEKSILEVSNAILIVETFDEFFSDKFGKDKKNIALHIWLQNLEGPMPAEKVNEIIQNIINKIEKEFRAKLRS